MSFFYNELEKQQLEERLGFLFNNIHAGVALYEAVDDGKDFIFLDMNPAGEKMDAINKKEIIGKKLTEIFPGVSEFGLLELMQKVFKSGDPTRLPIRQYKDHKMQVWRENFIFRLKSGKVVTIYDDVTAQKQYEENLQVSDKIQKEMNHILQIALEDLSMTQMLKKIISRITSLNWLSFEDIGSIFLYNEEKKELVLKAEKNFHSDLLNSCSKIPLGNCLCGRAAQNKAILFCNHINKEHEIQFNWMKGHGHYCAPILTGEKKDLLGVLNVYVKEGTEKTIREMAFLTAVAGVLATVIQKKRVEAEKQEVLNQLLETSRIAGMSEVATGVLHNIGNIVNNVNISATHLQEKLDKSSIIKMSKVSELLQSNMSNLEQYILQDEKGRQIPHYIIELSKILEKEQEELKNEITGCLDKIHHISDIINLQQHVAGSSGFIEKLQISDVIEEALKINHVSLNRHDVDIEKNYDDDMVLEINRLKVLQILINLISNAKAAMRNNPMDVKRVLRISIVKESNTNVAIKIADTGAGLKDEVLEKLFTYGFTTKKDGHGFGLHNSLLAAEELGGTLTAENNKVGPGAVFTLFIPVVSGNK